MVRDKCVILNPDNACRGTHPRRVDLPRTLPSGSSRILSCIREDNERSLALRGRRLTRPSNFLYMILYIGGGHTAGCAVLAFVCLQ